MQSTGRHFNSFGVLPCRKKVLLINDSGQTLRRTSMPSSWRIDFSDDVDTISVPTELRRRYRRKYPPAGGFGFLVGWTRSWGRRKMALKLNPKSSANSTGSNRNMQW
ncbi:hypothetical protein EVAR_57745_1 [Eumeta japonica]|uniref:Uncharacterized protein n=1 Tax=Eumeta variegata TaxID=151549 RepID=A0A4C1ZUF4_EUMVA|nr:hypothetical protein EVAR_57745_1 [Eumeta japonica]